MFAMSRLIRRALAFFALSATLLLTFTAAAPTAQAQGKFVDVSGVLFPIDDVTGEERPAGPNLIAERPVKLVLCAGNTFNYCGGSEAFAPTPDLNGFSGVVIAQERVVRIGQNSTFTFFATQTFTGIVYINGVPHRGSVTQTLTAKGLLNSSLPVGHPDQGATTLDGTFVTTGRGTGDLASLVGNGRISWPGGASPVFYTGKVKL
jgi:hypothetical protein